MIGEKMRTALATAQLAILQTEIDRLTAENERLREALKAAVGALNSVHETDGLLDDELAAYQAARAALEQP